MTSPENRDREFIVYNEERYTFGQAYARAAALAHVLRTTFSVGKGDRVCIAMRNYPEWCIAFIAISAIGSVAVPVNGWWGPHEMEYGLQDSGSRVLICDKERHARAAHCLARLGIRALSVRAAIAGVASFGRLVGAALAAGKPMPEVPLHTDDAAAMMYTSGTTGNPKGVVLTHRGITNQMTLVRSLRRKSPCISALFMRLNASQDVSVQTMQSTPPHPNRGFSHVTDLAARLSSIVLVCACVVRAYVRVCTKRQFGSNRLLWPALFAITLQSSPSRPRCILPVAFARFVTCVSRSPMPWFFYANVHTGGRGVCVRVADGLLHHAFARCACACI